MTEPLRDQMALSLREVAGKSVIAVALAGGVALVGWRWLDLFTWPLSPGRELLDGGTIALVVLSAIWIERARLHRDRESGAPPSPPPSLARAISAGACVGLAISTIHTFSSLVSQRHGFALYRAVYYGTIVLGVVALAFAIWAATLAARAPNSGSPRSKGVTVVVVGMILYGVKYSLPPWTSELATWWALYALPPVLITCYYFALRRLSASELEET